MTVVDLGLPPEARNADGSWRLFVDGAWIDCADGSRFEVHDPADGSLVATVTSGGAADVDAAVTAAWQSFEAGRWRSKSPQSRASALLRLAQQIARRSDELAAIETRCNGMPLRDAKAMVKRCVSSLEYASGFAQRAYGQSVPVANRYLDVTLREPIGVCALIVPWNGPLLSALWKLGPAIVLGNSVVLKPSELTPLTALVLAECCQEAGIPPGVVNMIAGGPATGAELVAHPLVNKIAFTGSTATGKAIMKVASEHVKRVTLELGGKAPNIFFEDGDVSDAVLGALSGLMRNTGQTCIAGARMLVQASMYDEFVERLTAAVDQLRVGPPTAESSQLGPIVSAKQLARVQSYVELAREEGAEVHGGGLLDGDGLAGGYYMRPGLITGAGNDLRVNQEEIFGPVGAVLPFSDEEEAVAIANATPYGLAAGVWTRDVKRALRVTRAVRAGTVWVNTYGWNFVEAPMGGFKESGLGRENGSAVIDAYTETKNVVIELDEDDSLDIYRLRDVR
ncbi:aldehyde dehydrogenase family protein [Nocardioides humi]|uniref:Aldehyde dehydrogenase family protein n=1 Tax=Nocardioides humi TaxID=449461 RepID=A0ABN1ZWN5_9ACTN|nr:aldehyde dehydrogenase family protein [Nocardioides humi]